MLEKEFFALEENKRFVIYGTEFSGRFCYEFLKKNALLDNVDSFMDSDESKHGLSLNGLRVKPISHLNGKPELVIIIASTYAEEIHKYIRDNGYNNRIYFYIYPNQQFIPIDIVLEKRRLSPTPPKEIPSERYSDFTMSGKIPVLHKYMDSRAIEVLHNTKDKYSSTFKELDNRTFDYYGKEVFAFYDALEDYPLQGENILIFGLAGCNCEAMALWKGAKHVYVVDYNKPICDHENITVVNHEELKALDIKFDVAFSFSSFEHDGLGAYGDPISPDADLEAMKFAQAIIKPDGLFFFGVPIGEDCLIWNLKRVYGKRRLPLLLKGWECRDIYYFENLDPFARPLGEEIQPLMILKNRKPNKKLVNEGLVHADSLIQSEKSSTRNGFLLRKILEMTMN